MPRYVALLRGVSPMNCKMPELKRCLEDAGFTNVKTLLSSGNVAFDTPRATSAATLQKRVEKAMDAGLDRGFMTIVRAQSHLQQLIEAEPFAGFRLPAGSKRVVTFLLHPDAEDDITLPIEYGDARILQRIGGEVLCAYVPNQKGPVFMQLLEKTYTKDITTRTWDTVAKCAKA